MKLFLLLLYVLSLDASAAAEDLEHRMATFLYQDQDYRQFVCGEQPGTIEEFRQRIEYHKEVLREHPLAVAYFVEPTSKAFNFYTGFFVVQGDEMKPQFIYFGSGIGAHKTRKHKGFKVVIGTERTGPASSEFHTYEWNGTNYAKTATTTTSTKPP
jgi:hypothetical protein